LIPFVKFQRNRISRGNLDQVTAGSQITDYTFDAADRMVGVTLPDASAIAYGYDADGRRVSQSIDGQVTDYLWDEASPYGDVVLETDGSGSMLASYVLGGTGLLSQTRSGVTSYYLQDGQGSTRALTNDSGVLIDTYDYTAFFDSLTGLYSLRARYYNPALGRLLSQDSLLPGWRCTEIKVTPRSRMRLNRPCSADWSNSPRMIVWLSGLDLTSSPSNQRSQRSSRIPSRQI